jgi:arylformamidase
MTAPLPTPVYLAYDQAGLDEQYDNQRHVAGARAIIDSYCAVSARARAAFATRLDIPYGPSPRERLDALLPEGYDAPRPINIFVHGGAWRLLSKTENAFPALGLCPAGAIVVVAGFNLATEVPLAQMVTEVRDLVAWVYRQADQFGGDRNRIFLTAHSSGAHLAAMTGATRWTETHGLPDDIVKGAVLVSGVYDLEPVRLTYRNTMLKLDPDTARQLSPIAQMPRPGMKVDIVCASNDTAEFRRQSRALAERWRERGVICSFQECEGRNHYDLILDLADPSAALVKRCLDQMGLAFAGPIA